MQDAAAKAVVEVENIESDTKERVIAKVMGKEYTPTKVVSIKPGQVIVDEAPATEPFRTQPDGFEELPLERSLPLSELEVEKLKEAWDATQSNGNRPDDVKILDTYGADEAIKHFPTILEAHNRSKDMPSSETAAATPAPPTEPRSTPSPALQLIDAPLLQRTMEVIAAAELGISVHLYRFIIFQVETARHNAIRDTLVHVSIMLDELIGGQGGDGESSSQVEIEGQRENPAA